MSCIAAVFERYSLKFLDKILQEGPQDSLSGTAPLMSTLYAPRPSPSVFAYCKPSKTEGGNGLEMRLTLGLIDKWYRIPGNFRGRKLSQISQFCGYSRKFSPQNWGCGTFGAAKVSNPRKFSPRKLYFSPIWRKFSPSKVSRYMVASPGAAVLSHLITLNLLAG